uniref:Uncharacterized protein n=1 Tax=Arundo donax TaxID=35708 RepID=A0A0A8XWT2_ARUDO
MAESIVNTYKLQQNDRMLQGIVKDAFFFFLFKANTIWQNAFL